MSTAAAEPTIPRITRGWRMRMALEMSGVTAQDMAETLCVSRQTISRWTHDLGTPPRAIYMREWARVTGVPYEWLEHGQEPEPPKGPPGAGRPNRRATQRVRGSKWTPLELSNAA